MVAKVISLESYFVPEATLVSPSGYAEVGDKVDNGIED